MRDLNISNIRSVDRALDILDSFTIEKPLQTIDEIIKHTKLPKTTAYRLLYTLERRGIIRYDEKTLEYKLGFKILGYFQTLSSSLDIVKDSEQILTDIQAATGQTVLMCLLEGDSVVYVFKRENQVGLKYSSSVGERRPLTYGVLGRALLAFLPDDRVENIFSQPLTEWTSNTRTDNQILLEELRKIRSDRVAVEIDKTNIGVTGVGAPIFNVEGNVIAAVGILGPTAQFTGDELEKAKDLLKLAAQRISHKMGFVEKQ